MGSRFFHPPKLCPLIFDLKSKLYPSFSYPLFQRKDFSRCLLCSLAAAHRKLRKFWKLSSRSDHNSQRCFLESFFELHSQLHSIWNVLSTKTIWTFAVPQSHPKSSCCRFMFQPPSILLFQLIFLRYFCQQLALIDPQILSVGKPSLRPSSRRGEVRIARWENLVLVMIHLPILSYLCCKVFQ